MDTNKTQITSKDNAGSYKKDNWFLMSNTTTNYDIDTSSELSDLSSNDSTNLSDTILTISDDEGSPRSINQERRYLFTGSDKVPDPPNTPKKSFWSRNKSYLLIGVTGCLLYLGYLVKSRAIIDLL